MTNYMTPPRCERSPGPACPGRVPLSCSDTLYYIIIIILYYIYIYIYTHTVLHDVITGRRLGSAHGPWKMMGQPPFSARAPTEQTLKPCPAKGPICQRVCQTLLCRRHTLKLFRRQAVRAHGPWKMMGPVAIFSPALRARRGKSYGRRQGKCSYGGSALYDML